MTSLEAICFPIMPCSETFRFFIFLAILAMFYIGKHLLLGKDLQSKSKKPKNELERNCVTSPLQAKAKMLDVCKQTEIAKKVEGMGIKGYHNTAL